MAPITPSLTELRSMQTRRQNATSLSLSTLSTASSGVVPGIGYLSGKAIKGTGNKILNVIEAVAIRRRQHSIKRLATQMEALEPDEWANWLVRNERKLNRAIADLLELSS
jgi:hypothetical protein